MAAEPEVEVDVARVEPAGARVRAIAVTPAAWKRLLAEGAGVLAETELATLRGLASFTRFEGKAGQALPFCVASGADQNRAPADRRGLFVGLGESAASKGRSDVPATSASVRSAAAYAAQALADGCNWTLEVRAGGGEDGAQELIAAALEGVLLSNYRFKRSGRAESGRRPGRCTVRAGLDASKADAALARARATVAGIVLTRDLVNAGAAEIGPDQIADAALALAARHGFATEVWRGAEVERRGFRMVAAVGRGSARPPTVTVLRRDVDASKAALALVGKGVVFDSGGLDLKPSDAMLLMRKDMAGAATVLGALEAAARLDVRVPVVAVLPSAENMVGPDCYRPGDVLTAYDGTTVEIGNTDAEGRLLLADGLGYAREQGAERLLDVATLTGAARVALGPDVPALFGTDEELVALIERASRASDERMWRMPLVDEYDRQLETPFADVNHVSHDKRAGAITAALFLRRFARDTPWAHVDLYGWEDGGRPETPKGANGMGVRTLVRVLEHFARPRQAL